MVAEVRVRDTWGVSVADALVVMVLESAVKVAGTVVAVAVVVKWARWVEAEKTEGETEMTLGRKGFGTVLMLAVFRTATSGSGLVMAEPAVRLLDRARRNLSGRMWLA